MSAYLKAICQPCSARRCTACLLVLILCLAVTGDMRADSRAEEYAVKAAFLFHFAQFVDWPEGTFREANNPLVYCTLGEDPFQGTLDASLNGKTAAGHPFQVRHVKRVQETHGCNVVFIGQDEKKQLSTTLTALKESPILTVGDSERFAQEGGMIGFCMEENKIRFDINLQSAERAKLKISARLLALAKTVIGGPKRD